MEHSDVFRYISKTECISHVLRFRLNLIWERGMKLENKIWDTSWLTSAIFFLFPRHNNCSEGIDVKVNVIILRSFTKFLQIWYNWTEGVENKQVTRFLLLLFNNYESHENRNVGSFEKRKSLGGKEKNKWKALRKRDKRVIINIVNSITANE